MKGILTFVIFLAIAFLFAINKGIAQPNKINWQTCFDKPDTDIPYDILQTDDGYLFLWNNYINTKLRITKLSKNGDVISEKEYGGSSDDGGIRMFWTQDGNILVIGATASGDGDVIENPYAGTSSFWLVKLDPDGNILWNKVFGNNHSNVIEDGFITSDDGALMFGWVTGSGGDVSQYYGAYDMWVVKADKDGNKLWDYTIGSPNIDFGISVIETSDKGVLLGGSSMLDPGGNIECEPYTWDNPEAILFKLDSAGNYQWQNCYGGSGKDWIETMVELPDGYLLGCYGRSNDGDLTGSGYHIGYSHTGTPTSDVWLVKIDFDGNIRWQKCYGGSGSEVPKTIHPMSNGNIVIVGNTDSNDGDVVGNHLEGTEDIWLFEINSVGELLWQKCLGSENREGYNFMTSFYKSDNEFVIGATSRRWNGGDIECDVNGADTRIWLFEIADSTMSLAENFNKLDFQIYPNPSNEAFVVELPVSSGQIDVYNTMGVLLHSQRVSENKTVIDSRLYPDGIYLVKCTGQPGNTASKKIIINHFK